LVAAWNEAEMIEQHIQAFLRLSYPQRELVLCAGGKDGTYERALAYANERVLVLQQQPGEGKQGALRRCLERASGQILFLTDADCLLDDHSFSGTVAPLLSEGQAVTTGTSQPLLRQRQNPFVLHQWCTDIFVNARRPSWSTGLLGRNCALTRQALDKAGGFAAQVRTGTDYYLAKLLLQQGERIRYVRDSAVETRYPETFRSYWRRQSRWVRNLLVHAPGFGARDEVAAALRTALVGWTMLLLPFLAFFAGPLVLALWGLLFAQACLAKWRYARFAHHYQGLHVPWSQWALTPLYVCVDFIAWSLPLVDWLRRTERW